MAEDRDPSLSLAFMRGHPAQAARVLEALPDAEAAALFQRAPARLGAAVLAAMLPRRAARCIDALDDVRALEVLAAMGTQPTVALLRHLPEARRQRLIHGLPTGTALASTLLLGYTEDTLGAWADPDIITLTADTRIGDAIERVRLAPPAHAYVFVTDAQQRLVGVVNLAALLQAPQGATLATLMQRPPAVLPANAPLSGAAAHPGWERGSTLPVVEAGERLVGALTRDALARAQRRSDPTPVGTATSVPEMFARGYWHTLSGLFESGLVLLPRVPAVLENPDGR